MTEEDGVALTSADVNGLTVSELRFPPGYLQDAFEPDLPYLALVLDGSLEKSFRTRTIDLGRECGLTIPVGATHGARFGAKGARILVVKPRDASHPVADSLDRLVDLRGPGFSWLAWRLAGELRATDAAAPLAAEGFALELIAGTCREAAAEERVRPSPAWLRSAEELLRARIADCIGLSELADAVGVHPMHLARTFRARHGLSVGEYGRRLRVAWAASEIARHDTSLAMIAAQAGFADQSHFTRVFKHQVGTTPARYREETGRIRQRNA
ncbi:MAG TPA: AraC family transcriptional regulator [Gaiellaceae bacterium]|nr:AraC family transcriptional regulator [Gaiellaceae bacterium]